ncbi:MAG TPA: hypothetical protein VG916_05950 [Gemmatimonadaceae bacterium]|nr:hypothetical protein [Gemmatimonadaceae bacterium]
MARDPIARTSAATPRPRRAAARLPGVVAACVGLAVTAPATAASQAFGIRPAVQPELRAAVVASGSSSVLAGAGVNVPAGLYLRFAASLDGGFAAGSDAGAITRVEFAGRFLADPFHEGRWGPYVGGGVAASWRTHDHGRPALVILVGTDLPSRGRWTPVVELGVGGGARVLVALRRTRSVGR